MNHEIILFAACGWLIGRALTFVTMEWQRFGGRRSVIAVIVSYRWETMCDRYLSPYCRLGVVLLFLVGT